MLEAGWYQFNQEYFRLSVQLAAKELEVLESRFSSLIVVATILVGFAFTALVELDVNTASLEALEEAGFDWMEDVYYVCVAVTIAFNLFVLFVATLGIVKGQRMALHGDVDVSQQQLEMQASLGFSPGMIGETAAPPAGVNEAAAAAGIEKSHDDVRQAIVALRALQPCLLFAFGASLISFVVGAIAIVWIKTQPVHHLVQGGSPNHIGLMLSAVFAVLLLVMLASSIWVNRLFRLHAFHEGKVAPKTTPGMVGSAALRQPLV